MEYNTGVRLMSYIGRGSEAISNVDKLDNITVSGATTYFRKRKQLDQSSFDGLWKLMSMQRWNEIREISTREGKQYEWWKDESIDPDEGFDY